MEEDDYKWETAGSLTPELERTPHSGMHKKRSTRRSWEHLSEQSSLQNKTDDGHIEVNTIM